MFVLYKDIKRKKLKHMSRTVLDAAAYASKTHRRSKETGTEILDREIFGTPALSCLLHLETFDEYIQHISQLQLTAYKITPVHRHRPRNVNHQLRKKSKN